MARLSARSRPRLAFGDTPAIHRSPGPAQAMGFGTLVSALVLLLWLLVVLACAVALWLLWLACGCMFLVACGLLPVSFCFVSVLCCLCVCVACLFCCLWCLSLFLVAWCFTHPCISGWLCKSSFKTKSVLCVSVCLAHCACCVYAGCGVGQCHHVCLLCLNHQ